MSIPFYAKSPNNQGYIKNMEVVGFCDLNGVNAFQMALYKTEEGRYYMYCGSFRGPGWNVVDVTDPTQPRVVNWLEACDPALASLIDGCIGPEWRRDAEKLEGLLASL